MRPSCFRQRFAVTLALAAASTVACRARAYAHDASDMPARAPEERPQGSPLAGGTTPAVPSSPTRWPLALIVAGVLVGAGGVLLLREELHGAPGACTEGPSGRASCPSAATGPGIGLVALLVGAHMTIGGVVWLAIDRRDRGASVALGIGPGALALRATF